MDTHHARRARGVLALLCAALFATQLMSAQSPAQTPPTPTQSSRVDDTLPVRRVVLYKNGVGYFEHLGRVSGNQSVTIDFTTGQLDDVLKSLTTLDLNGGRIAGVSYNSDAGLDRQLGSLRLPLGQETTRAQFLRALRGARLDVGAGGTHIVGRLLSVEQVQRKSDNTTSTVDALALISETGQMQTIALDPGVSVRILEAGLNQDVGRYLSIVASARDRDVRRMTIATAGTGDRNLFVSYISEVPVWKATYRLVLPDAERGGQPLLQGWAVIDNTIGEDWTNVELSLVAGSPQSFVQSISRPYYIQRPTVPLPQRVLLTPQTHQAALATTGTAGGTGAGTFQPSPRPDFNRNTTIDGVPGWSSERTPVQTTSSALQKNLGGAMTVNVVEDARAAQRPDATAAPLGDLFEYKIATPVTLRKNQSSLVPILSAPVVAEKVSLWNPSVGAHPLRAVWLTNQTGLTLDGGNFSVSEGQAFAGEGLLDPLAAGERRLLSYAIDLGVTVDLKAEPAPSHVSRVRASHGVLIESTEDRVRRVYTLRNEDASARTVVLEQAVRAGSSVSGTIEPSETTASWYRFRVPVDPKATATLTVDEISPSESTIEIDDVTEESVALLVRDRVLDKGLEAALRQVLSSKIEIDRLATGILALNAEIGRIGTDQLRVRENMKALKGTPEERQLLQRYVKELDAQETRLATIRSEVQRLDTERDTAQAALDRLIEGLAF